MIDPGSVAIGALCMLVLVVALVCVAIWYVASGVRVKLDGLRFVDRSSLRDINWADGPHADGPLPITILPKSNLPTKPEDFYEMAKERDPE